MKYLLDTHTLIWFLEGDHRISSKALTFILSEENQRFVSIASIWEIAIKVSIRKLEMKAALEKLPSMVWKNDIEILPITVPNVLGVASLPFHHRDPFDRIIIAQAIHEKMDILGRDAIFDRYLNDEAVKRTW